MVSSGGEIEGKIWECGKIGHNKQSKIKRMNDEIESLLAGTFFSIHVNNDYII